MPGRRTAPDAGTPVALEPCGVNAKTVWIFDPGARGNFFALISAATSRNFRHPFALSVLVRGFPLVTAPLATGVPAPCSPTSCGGRGRASCRALAR